MAYYDQPEQRAPFLSLPAYLYGSYSVLEPLRRWLWTGYIWQAIVVPRASALPVAASGQVEDQVQLPAGSWLIGFAGYSPQDAGFRFNIYDAGAQDYALSDRWDNGLSGASDQDMTDGQILHVLPEPYCLVGNGRLQVRVANLATVAAALQLLLHFAVPLEKVGRAG
jgi:hypothetical protein